jgi:hypothetical protein
VNIFLRLKTIIIHECRTLSKQALQILDDFIQDFLLATWRLYQRIDTDKNFEAFAASYATAPIKYNKGNKKIIIARFWQYLYKNFMPVPLDQLRDMPVTVPDTSLTLETEDWVQCQYDALLTFLQRNALPQCVQYFQYRFAGLSVAEIKSMLGLSTREHGYLFDQLRYWARKSAIAGE